MHAWGPDDTTLTLQALCLAETAQQDEALFVHLSAEVAPDPRGGLRFWAGGSAGFGTYFNLLNLDLWANRCRLDGLWLQLAGKGRFELRVSRVALSDPAANLSGAEVVLTEAEVALTPTGMSIDLGREIRGGGVIIVTLTAQTPAWLHKGRFVTRAPDPDPLHPFSLAIVVTSFQREAQVARGIARLTDLLGDGVLNGLPARLIVVDNAQSLTLAPHPALTLIPNRNLGGAGGFARGLLAAQVGGVSHCLFMDDDAACHSESLRRTAAFLRLARNPATALAGAMMTTHRPWEMWENGARFDRICHPQSQGADLRLLRDVLEVAKTSAQPNPPNFYGGWWFFAFPLSQARSYPFPFFVRGDDISFSLANDFSICALNGVVSWQPSFGAKESPLTHYLDLRSHLHHHLTWPRLDIGRLATVRIALWFVLRALAKMHYESAAALLWAWQDMMRGPDHFSTDPGLVARRADIAALTRQEKWAAADNPAPTPTPAKPLPLPLAWLMKITLNGHLLPFSRIWGRSLRLDAEDKGPLWPVWGAVRLCYCDTASGRSYTVRHDKAKFWQLLGRSAGLTLRWLHRYPALAQAYRDGYGPATTQDYWTQQFAKGGHAAKPEAGE